MKVISFFNHKGGVSKTTTAFHLAWKLNELGKRVLLVDTDSQCNLTLTCIGEEQYEEFVRSEPNNNIKYCLDTAFYSKPQLIEAPDCVRVKGRDGLFLLPGSFEITEFEVQLGISFQLSNSFSTMNSLPGSFYYLFEKCAERLGIDYVLVDLNPSLSAINQALISSSDYFILPTSPDYFSQMAVKSMARILPQWEKWAMRAREVYKNSSYPLPMVKPKFLGYSVNDFNIRNSRPTTAFADIINRLNEIIQKELVPALENVDMTIRAVERQDVCLAKISNFQHLQAKYQEYGIPVFALSDDQIGTQGNVLAEHKRKQSYFNDIFTTFANQVISLTALQ